MDIDNLLEGIQKPARYIGGEYNSIKKPWNNIAVKVCLSYPDIYEVGMSYLGIKILYHLLNREPDILCERVFAPWPDMEDKLRTLDIPLFSLESRKSLKEFDIVGFSLGYELTYTNFLNILNLGQIPIFSKERKNSDPLIIAGGPCALNPAPLSKFIDAFLIGEAEEAILEILNVYKKYKNRRREDILKAVEKIEGVYIPSLHNEKISSLNFKVKKRIIKNLENSFYPTEQIVPFIEVIHDRIAIEIMRGCPNKCRFCQAQFLYKPLRLRSKRKILELAESSLRKTGYEQLSFLSLSSSDHPYILEIVNSFNEKIPRRDIHISFPSLRIEELSTPLPNLISKNKKTGLTFAPESASAKLRKRLNKQINIERLFNTAHQAFKSGWRRLKLYFMIGLPFEREEDLIDIVSLVFKLSNLKKDIDGKRAELTLSINNFIPKPHTPFQWLGIETKENLVSKQNFLKKMIKDSRIKLDFRESDSSFLEAALSNGDERLNDILFYAWKNGAKFDSWKQFFKIDIWEKAFSNFNLSLEHFASSEANFSDNLPWDFIDIGTSKTYLIEEAKRAGIREDV